MNSIELIIIIALMASGTGYALLILLFSIGWFRLRKVVSTGVIVSKLSVIVPVRDEAKNIQRLIKHLSQQDYPEKLCELILVNDHSSDDSMKEMQAHARSPLFRILDLPKGKYGKKNAIQHGISHASGQLIITLDADCHPGKQWLKTIAANYDGGRYKMLAAPLAVENPRGITAKFQALEFLSLIGSGAGALGTGMPIMCNGANLAYERSAFEEVEGFKGNEHIPGGDDIFLMEKFCRHFGRKSITFVKDRKAMVYTRQSKGPVAFIRQRMRWVAKSPAYRNPFIIAVALIVLLFNMLLFSALVAGIYSSLILKAFIAALIIKCIVDFPLMWKLSSFAKQKRLMLFYIPFQLFYFIFITLAGIAGNLFSYQWKGRKH